MKMSYPTPVRSTGSLPLEPTWFKKINTATGNIGLAKTVQLSYQSGVGELIWAMRTCQPNIAYDSVKLSQANL